MRYTLSTPLFIYELGQRANQEDSLYPPTGMVSANDRIFILCDGMGGHEAGEVASATVCESLGQWFRTHHSSDAVLTTEDFNRALAAAYDALDVRDNGTIERKMGTTLTFLMFHAGGVTAAHIGDSRIYQLRPGMAKPLFKTNDHSLVNELLRLGEISEEEARTSPNRNVITRAMQPGGERRAKADITLLTDIQPGDWFYLCSDGMLEQMNDSELMAILTDTSLSVDEKRAELIHRTAGNKDNHTAWLIQVQSIEGGKKESMEKDNSVAPVVIDIGTDDDTPVPTADVVPVRGNVAVREKRKSRKYPVEDRQRKNRSWIVWIVAFLVGLLIVWIVSAHVIPSLHN